jgi:hypothetical protein
MDALPIEEEPKDQEYKTICPTLSKKFCNLRTNDLTCSIHQRNLETVFYMKELFRISEQLNLMRKARNTPFVRHN